MSVDAEWSEDNESVIGPYTLTCWRFLMRIINMRSGETLRGKRRTIGWERAGRVMWKIDTSKIITPVCVG
jgi:hypothetical protein